MSANLVENLLQLVPLGPALAKGEDLLLVEALVSSVRHDVLQHVTVATEIRPQHFRGDEVAFRSQALVSRTAVPQEPQAGVQE